jgi:hypothetical protein
MNPRLLAPLLAAACAGSSSARPTSTEGIVDITPANAPPGIVVLTGDGVETKPLYTPEQLRKAMPVGSKIVYRYEEQGKPPTVEHWIVSAADAEAVTLDTRVFTPEGQHIEERPAIRYAWRMLATHTIFPSFATKITDGTVEVPAGTFTTKLYTVMAEDGAIQRFHFGDVAGPPIQMIIERGGLVAVRMTLLERR